MSLRRVLGMLLCVLWLAIPAAGAEYRYRLEEGAEGARDGWDKLVEALPKDLQQEMDGLSPTDEAGTREALNEKVSIRYWLNRLWEAAAEHGGMLLPKLIPLLSLLLIMAAARMTLSAGSEALSASFLTYGRLVLALGVFGVTAEAITAAQAYLTRLCGVMNLMTPVMEMLSLAGGGVTQGKVAVSGVMLAVTVIGNLNAGVLAPILHLLFVLSAAASVSGEMKFSAFPGALRRLFLRVWQIAVICFSFLLGSQSVLARGADSLAVRGAKFALGSMIPMAGSVLAEAFTTVTAGIGMVRTCAGIGGIVVLLLLLLPGIVPPMLLKWGLGLLESGAELLRLEDFAALLREAKGILELLIAILLYTSLLFLFAVFLFTKGQVGA